jgi:nitroreductase
MYDLEDAVRQRRSIRMFLPDRPVPRESIDEALDLAIRAPSNSNIQPWHVVFASVAARDRLVAALLEAAQAAPPKVPALPEHFSHFRSETGKVVYGSMGIARDDVAPGVPRCCATGNSSARHWPALCSWTGSSSDRGLPRDHLRTVEHP